MFMFIIANVRINFLDHQLFKSSKFGFHWNYLLSHIAHLKIMAVIDVDICGVKLYILSIYWFISNVFRYEKIWTYHNKKIKL